MFYISYFSNIYPSKKKRKFCNINLNHKGLLRFFLFPFSTTGFTCVTWIREIIWPYYSTVFSVVMEQRILLVYEWWYSILYYCIRKEYFFLFASFFFLICLFHFLSGVDWRRFFQALVIHSFVRFLVNHLLHSWQINLICLYKEHLEEFALVLFIEIVGGIFSKHSLFFPGWWIGWIIHVSISSFLDKMWNGEVPDTSASSSFYNSRT